VRRVHIRTRETVYRHFRFGTFVGVLWIFALQSAQAFAMNPTLSGTSDAIGQRVAPVVTRVKEPGLAGSTGSISIPGIPEPGILALLGFGLVLLGFSYGRTSGRLNKPLHPTGKGGSHLQSLQTSGGRGSPQVGDM
jgi:hypothetical protein